jgi:DNA primase
VNILDLLISEGIQPRRVANSNGGEFASPCPGCGGEDRLRSWPEQGKDGRFWCRQCGAAGDTVDYLRRFRKMGFPEACQYLGRELPPRAPYKSGKKAQASTTHHQAPQAPRQETSVIDSVLWQVKAQSLVDEAAYNLLHYQQDVWFKWLTVQRGLNEETIKTASLGVMLLKRFPDAKDWGLKPELKENGQIKKLWLPRGHIIPLTQGREVLRIKFRRPKGDGDPRYLLLRGSSPQARVINPQSPYFCIIENELDGLLVAQEGSAIGIGVIALGSASINPASLAPEVVAALKVSSCLLISLDFDEAQGAGDKGAWAGGRAAKTWLRKFPQARRWPAIKGKDVAEMWQAGVNIKTWLEIGLERAIKKEA